MTAPSRCLRFGILALQISHTVDKFRTLKQAKEYCDREVEGLEFCGDWSESDRINTTQKLEVYEGYPLVLNEMGNPTAIYEPVYSTGYYYINAIDI